MYLAKPCTYTTDTFTLRYDIDCMSKSNFIQSRPHISLLITCQEKYRRSIF